MEKAKENKGLLKIMHDIRNFLWELEFEFYNSDSCVHNLIFFLSIFIIFELNTQLLLDSIKSYNF